MIDADRFYPGGIRISAPMSLRNHYQPTDSKLKSKAPIAREDSVGGEEDLVLESTVLFKLTQYQIFKMKSCLAKGTKATELETKNKNGSHQQLSGAAYLIQKNKLHVTPPVTKDPPPPSLKRSVSSIEEEAAFRIILGGNSEKSNLLQVLTAEYKPNVYMKMLQRKGGKVVDRTLRKCYIAVLAHEQKFNKALGCKVCATDGDNVLTNCWNYGSLYKKSVNGLYESWNCS